MLSGDNNISWLKLYSIKVRVHRAIDFFSRVNMHCPLNCYDIIFQYVSFTVAHYTYSLKRER